MDTLWVAAGKGIAVFVYSDMEYRFKDFYKNFDILPNSVTTIEIFAGRIWLGTDKGLLSAPSAFDKYTINDPALWTVYNTAKGMTDNNILDLEVINDALWIGTSAGITTINSNLQLRKDENWGISDQDAANVVLTTGHRIIISKNSGEIYDYDPNTGDKILISTSGYEITNIVSDSSDDVWVGLSEGGIWQPENNNRIVLDGPGQNQIRYVIKDGSNKIWASSGKFKLTPNKGFFVFDGNSWTNIDYLDFGWSDLGNTDIIFEDHNDNVWLGSWGGGLTTYKDDQFIYFHNYKNSGRRIVSSKDTVIIENMATIDSKYTGFFSGVVTYLTYEVIGTINLDNFNRLWVSNYYAANDNLIAVIPYKSDGFISLEKADK